MGRSVARPGKTTGVVAQFWLEHRPVTPEVASSSLVYPAKRPSRKRGSFCFSTLTQEAYPPPEFPRKGLTMFDFSKVLA